jgi:hypothetical protein
MKVFSRHFNLLFVCIVLLSIAFAGCTTTQKTATSSSEPAAPVQVVTSTPVAAAAVMCPAGFADCNGACRDITSDVLNCGGCGFSCPESSICKDSQCLCREGFAACNGKCQDVTNDTANCGACKNQCSVNEKCTNGVCTAPGSSSTGTNGQNAAVASCEDPARTVCGDFCYDLTSDPQNCGFCKNVCAGGLNCVSGVCTTKTSNVGNTLVAAPCGTGKTRCSGSCVDLQTDPNNCGKCKASCGALSTCQSGVCTSTLVRMTTSNSNSLSPVQQHG